MLCVSILVVPLLSLADGSNIDAGDLLAIFYVYFVPVLLLAQGFLLLVPVGIVQERPVKRRGIVVPAVIGSIPMAFLTFLFLFSIVLMVGKEKASDNHVVNWTAFVYLGVFLISVL